MLTRKVWFVADGHNMNKPESITYASVVLREIFWFYLLISALNDLDVFYADLHNAYLNTPPCEKAWFRARTKFGQYKYRVVGTD